jgi:hypothetical protein
MSKNSTRSRGIGIVQFVVALVILLVAGYVIFQLLYPVYAFQRLEGTMEEWIKITVQSGDDHHTEMMEKVGWIVDRHKIPLDPADIRIEHDPERRVLSVYVEVLPKLNSNAGIPFTNRNCS